MLRGHRIRVRAEVPLPHGGNELRVRGVLRRSHLQLEGADVELQRFDVVQQRERRLCGVRERGVDEDDL